MGNKSSKPPTNEIHLGKFTSQFQSKKTKKGIKGGGMLKRMGKSVIKRNKKKYDNVLKSFKLKR